MVFPVDLSAGKSGGLGFQWNGKNHVLFQVSDFTSNRTEIEIFRDKKGRLAKVFSGTLDEALELIQVIPLFFGKGKDALVFQWYEGSQPFLCFSIMKFDGNRILTVREKETARGLLKPEKGMLVLKSGVREKIIYCTKSGIVEEFKLFLCKESDFKFFFEIDEQKGIWVDVKVYIDGIRIRPGQALALIRPDCCPIAEDIHFESEKGDPVRVEYLTANRVLVPKGRYKIRIVPGGDGTMSKTISLMVE